MLIDRVIYPITTLGPGNRLVIWTVGCSKHCSGCANPELWQADNQKNIDVNTLVELIMTYIKANHVDGVTITGGDPLEQVEDVLKLVEGIRGLTDDILIYTGYTYEELEAMNSDDVKMLMSKVDVLIDGRYVDELNYEECVLRGSQNQSIIYLNKDMKERYNNYLQKGRKIQNVFSNSQTVSVGIHNRDITKEKGAEKHE